MDIYIYGTGSGAEKFLESIKEYHNEVSIKGFVDTNESKIGTLFNNKIVIGLDEFSSISEYDYLFIATQFQEVYFKVLKNGIPQSKVVLVYSNVIDDLHTIQFNKNLEVKSMLHGNYEDEDNECIARYKEKNRLDIYLFCDNNNKENALNLIKSSKYNFNVLGFIDNNNLKNTVELKFDYILLFGNDHEKYYKLIASGVKADLILPINYEIVDKLYYNEIKKRRDAKIIYKESKISSLSYSLKSSYKKISFEKVKKPEVSIVIPVFNDWKYTYNCLCSIKENVKKIKYEIVIIDNNSTDETKDIYKFVENVIVIKNKEQLSYLKSCNKASNYCNGDYIAFLTNYTHIQVDWMESLVTAIKSNKRIGIVGSKISYSNGKLQQAGGIIFNDGSRCDYGCMDDFNKPQYNYVKEVDYVSSLSMLVNRKLWEEIGGFDEQFSQDFYYDCDLAFEIRKRGYRVIYQPKSIVVYFNDKSNNINLKNKLQSRSTEDKFIFKWKDEIQSSCSNKDLFIARDRSKDKKVIVMINEFVPVFDKDCASRTIYDYINVLLKMNVKIVFIGSNFKKMEPYTSILQQKGVEVLYGPSCQTLWREWIKNNEKYINVVFIHKPDVAVKYLKFIKLNTNLKTVYQVADLHFLRKEREYKVTGDIDSLKQSKYYKKIEEKLIKDADIVTTVSDFEEKIIREKFNCKNVMIMPTMCYEKILDNNVDVLNRKDLMFIGGFAHKPNVDAVLWFIKDIFPLIKAQISNIKVHIAGSNVPNEIVKLGSDDIIIHGYVTDAELTDLYSKCRISIIPLRYGAGVKGKVIEAMYNNIQIVSTSIGIEGIESIEGYIKASDTAEDFSNEVVYLYKKPNLIAKNISKYKEYISHYLSYDNAMKKFKKILG